MKKVGSRRGMKSWIFSDGLMIASCIYTASIDVSVTDIYSIAKKNRFVNRFLFVVWYEFEHGKLDCPAFYGSHAWI